MHKLPFLGNEHVMVRKHNTFVCGSRYRCEHCTRGHFGVLKLCLHCILQHTHCILQQTQMLDNSASVVVGFLKENAPHVIVLRSNGERQMIATIKHFDKATNMITLGFEDESQQLEKVVSYDTFLQWNEYL